MEKIEIKPMEQETKTIYKSVDGLEFDDANKCKEYEDALARVIYERYEREYVKHIAPEYNMFCDIAGSEEYEMHVVEVKTQRAVDDIIMLRKIYASRHNTSKSIVVIMRVLRMQCKRALLYLSVEDIVCVVPKDTHYAEWITSIFTERANR